MSWWDNRTREEKIAKLREWEDAIREGVRRRQDRQSPAWFRREVSYANELRDQRLQLERGSR